MQNSENDIRSERRNNNYDTDNKSEHQLITLMNGRIGYKGNGTRGYSIHHRDEHPSYKKNQEIKDITIRKGDLNTKKMNRRYETHRQKFKGETKVLP